MEVVSRFNEFLSCEIISPIILPLALTSGIPRIKGIICSIYICTYIQIVGICIEFYGDRNRSDRRQDADHLLSRFPTEKYLMTKELLSHPTLVPVS